jgi:hypothetical protein
MEREGESEKGRRKIDEITNFQPFDGGAFYARWNALTF